MSVTLLYGAALLIYAVAMSCVLTHWAQVELEKQCDAKDGDQTSAIEPSQGQGAEALLRSGTAESSDGANVPVKFGSVCVFFLILGWVLPLAYVERKGLMGELLMDKADMDLSYVYMVHKMMTDRELRTQPLVIVVAVVLTLVNLIMPIVQLLVLWLSARTAGKDLAKSRRFYQMAEFCATFDCTEVCLVTLLVLSKDFGRFISYLIKEECKTMDPITNNTELMAAAGIDTSNTNCIDAYFYIGPAPVALLNMVIVRSLTFRFIRQQNSRLQELHNKA